MNGNSDVYPRDSERQNFGITMREYFSAMAMQGMLSHPDLDSTDAEIGRENITLLVRDAVAVADALLAELAKEPK